MAQVLEVRPKDLCVTIEHRAADLEKLLKALDQAEGTPVTDDQKESWKYLTDEFYPFLVQLVKDLKEHGA